MNAAAVTSPSGEAEDFAALLDASMGENSAFAGSIMSGRVIRLDGDVAIAMSA
jgi:small subunit ribosomal protein S1